MKKNQRQKMKCSKKVMTIGKEGEVSGLYDKTAASFYSSIGEQAIRRVSLIEFDDAEQRWYVKFICKFNKTGKEAGFQKTLSGDCLLSIDAHATFSAPAYFKKEVAYFNTYEEGVQAEVSFLNNLRKKGVYPVGIKVSDEQDLKE